MYNRKQKQDSDHIGSENTANAQSIINNGKLANLSHSSVGYRVRVPIRMPSMTHHSAFLEALVRSFIIRKTSPYELKTKITTMAVFRHPS